LFAGIFATMMPALDWLEINAVKLGAPTATVFFSGSGLFVERAGQCPDLSHVLERSFGAPSSIKSW